MKLVAIPSLILLSSMALSAGVVDQTICSLTNAGGMGSASQTGTSSCSVSLPGPTFLSGTGKSGAVVVSANVANNGFFASEQVQSAPALNQSGTAEAMVSGTIELDTAGPARTGVVSLLGSITESASPDGARGSVAVNLGALSGNCAFFLVPLGSPFACGLIPSPSVTPTTMAFELGQPFRFGYSFDLAAASSQLLGTDLVQGGTADVSLNFQFFEADGVTSVTAFAVPEASEIPMVGLGLFVILFGRNRPWAK